jgi:2-polyprenyl-6-methoxyphenol hydroxylase-like FAD-dependent oxidoreductase
MGSVPQCPSGGEPRSSRFRHITGSSPALSGWEPGYTFFQSNLEAVLDRAVRAQPSAAVHRGWGAEALTQADDYVALTLRRPQNE